LKESSRPDGKTLSTFPSPGAPSLSLVPALISVVAGHLLLVCPKRRLTGDNPLRRRIKMKRKRSAKGRMKR
jgi:hypothetical protein